MLFCHDRCSAFNSEYLEFEVLHFQIVGLDKQTGDEGANVLAVLTASMRACAREAAKNVFFGLWLYHPHPIVDFALTVEVLSLHYAAQDAAKAALIGSNIPFGSESGHCLRRHEGGHPAQKGC